MFETSWQVLLHFVVLSTVQPVNYLRDKRGYCVPSPSQQFSAVPRGHNPLPPNFCSSCPFEAV